MSKKIVVKRPNMMYNNKRSFKEIEDMIVNNCIELLTYHYNGNTLNIHISLNSSINKAVVKYEEIRHLKL